MFRRLLVGVSLVLVAAATVQAQGISAAERDALIAQLKKSQKALEDATKELSETQWKFKPAPDRWSVADCVEHLTLSEELLNGIIAGRVLATPAAPEKKDPTKAKEKDAMVLKMIPDRTNRAQAPEQLVPSGRWPTMAEMLAEFKARRAKTIEYAKTTDVDLRAHFMDSPVIKEMDAYQWFLFLSAHTERHVAQMLEVKADPNFPKQ